MEITKRVERLEILEEKCGIAISALYASYETDSILGTKIIINFDVNSLSGGGLERTVYMHASAYNSAGQLLGTSHSNDAVKFGTFGGFQPVSITIYDVDEVPEKIRLFPSLTYT